jgi:hypothetical protein
MPRGPLPKPQSRRRNKPTIETVELRPRKGKAPAVPRPYKLKESGKAFWSWAWKLPQATKWDDGTRYFAARRASLEDDLSAVDEIDGLDVEALFEEVLDPDDELHKMGRQLDFLVGRLKALAVGRVQIMKEMRELDNRLGLNPKALLDLRWTIAEPETKSAKESAETKGDVAELDDYRDRLG